MKRNINEYQLFFCNMKNSIIACDIVGTQECPYTCDFSQDYLIQKNFLLKKEFFRKRILANIELIVN